MHGGQRTSAVPHWHGKVESPLFSFLMGRSVDDVYSKMAGDVCCTRMGYIVGRSRITAMSDSSLLATVMMMTKPHPINTNLSTATKTSLPSTFASAPIISSNTRPV